MAGIIYELIEVLEEQRECYEGLCTLARYKQEAVVAKNLELLQEVVTTEEQFAGRLTILDKKREQLLKDVSIVTGMNYKELNVTGIAEKLGQNNEASKKLVKIRGELHQLIEELKKQNELNAILINQSLEFVDFTINAIESTQSYIQPSGYNKPGEDNIGHNQRSYFDKKQ
ncbi:MAG: flagellar protein FlgN [Clostridia bacterium]|nr:flagellar protein FlgN [Clostridia bacterium]